MSATTRPRRAPTSRASIAAWWAQCERNGHRCTYCGQPSRSLVIEHVEPLSRGGQDVPENVVPACGPCNTSKRDRFLLEWMLARDPGAVCVMEELRPLRERAGLTQQQLADKAKVRQATVSALETGTAAGIRRDTAVRLARALGVKPPELFCPPKRGRSE